MHLSKTDFIPCLAREISKGNTPWYDSLEPFNPRIDESQQAYEDRVQKNKCCGGSSHTTTFPCVKCPWNGNNDNVGELGTCQLCLTLNSDISKCTHYAVATHAKCNERRIAHDKLKQSMCDQYGSDHTSKIRFFDDDDCLMKLKKEELNSEVEKRKDDNEPLRKKRKLLTKQECVNFLVEYCDASVFLVDKDLPNRLNELDIKQLQKELK